MFDYEIFCKNIKELRELKSMNKYEMSIQADIQYQYYCDIENGKSIPNFRAVISIANALNTNITKLISNNYSNSNDYIKSDIISMLQTISDKNILQKYLNIIIFLKTRDKEFSNGI